MEPKHNHKLSASTMKEDIELVMLHASPDEASAIRKVAKSVIIAQYFPFYQIGAIPLAIASFFILDKIVKWNFSKYFTDVWEFIPLSILLLLLVFPLVLGYFTVKHRKQLNKNKDFLVEHVTDVARKIRVNESARTAIEIQKERERLIG